MVIQRSLIYFNFGKAIQEKRGLPWHSVSEQVKRSYNNPFKINQCIKPALR